MLQQQPSVMQPRPLTNLRTKYRAQADRARPSQDRYARMNLIQRIAASDPHQPIRTFLWNADRDLRNWKDKVMKLLGPVAALGPVDAHLYDEVRIKSFDLAKRLDQIGRIVLNVAEVSPRNNPYRDILMTSLARFIAWTADETDKKLTAVHGEMHRELMPPPKDDTPPRSDPPDGPPEDFAMLKRL